MLCYNLSHISSPTYRLNHHTISFSSETSLSKNHYYIIIFNSASNVSRKIPLPSDFDIYSIKSLALSPQGIYLNVSSDNITYKSYFLSKRSFTTGSPLKDTGFTLVLEVNSTLFGVRLINHDYLFWNLSSDQELFLVKNKYQARISYTISKGRLYFTIIKYHSVLNECKLVTLIFDPLVADVVTNITKIESNFEHYDSLVIYERPLLLLTNHLILGEYKHEELKKYISCNTKSCHFRHDLSEIPKIDIILHKEDNSCYLAGNNRDILVYNTMRHDLSKVDTSIKLLNVFTYKNAYHYIARSFNGEYVVNNFNALLTGCLAESNLQSFIDIMFVGVVHSYPPLHIFKKDPNKSSPVTFHQSLDFLFYSPNESSFDDKPPTSWFLSSSQLVRSSNTLIYRLSKFSGTLHSYRVIVLERIIDNVYGAITARSYDKYPELHIIDNVITGIEIDMKVYKITDEDFINRASFFNLGKVLDYSSTLKFTPNGNFCTSHQISKIFDPHYSVLYSFYSPSYADANLLTHNSCLEEHGLN